jgi:hypothetical protein
MHTARTNRARVDGSSMRDIGSMEVGWREMEGHRQHQSGVNWRSGEESRLLVDSKPHKPR